MGEEYSQHAHLPLTIVRGACEYICYLAVIARSGNIVRWFHSTTLTCGKPINVSYLHLELDECQFCNLDLRTFAVLDPTARTSTGLEDVCNTYLLSTSSVPYSLNSLPPIHRKGTVQDCCSTVAHLVRLFVEAMHLGDDWMLLDSYMTSAQFHSLRAAGESVLTGVTQECCRVCLEQEAGLRPSSYVTVRRGIFSSGVRYGWRAVFVSDSEVYRGQFEDRFDSVCDTASFCVSDRMQSDGVRFGRKVCCRAVVQKE